MVTIGLLQMILAGLCFALTAVMLTGWLVSNRQTAKTARRHTASRRPGSRHAAPQNTPPTATAYVPHSHGTAA